MSPRKYLPSVRASSPQVPSPPDRDSYPLDPNYQGAVRNDDSVSVYDGPSLICRREPLILGKSSLTDVLSRQSMGSVRPEDSARPDDPTFLPLDSRSSSLTF